VKLQIGIFLFGFVPKCAKTRNGRQIQRNFVGSSFSLEQIFS